MASFNEREAKYMAAAFQSLKSLPNVRNHSTQRLSISTIALKLLPRIEVNTS
jgi:hypothetical protein